MNRVTREPSIFGCCERGARDPGGHAQQRRGRERGRVAFIAALRIGALLRLREILGREHAEADRRAGRELHVHDSARALARDEVEVRRFAANNRAQRDERVEAIGLDEISARQRQLEAPGNVEDADVVVGDVAVAQRALRAVDEPIGEVGVEARGRRSRSGVPHNPAPRGRAPSRASRCGDFV